MERNKKHLNETRALGTEKFLDTDPAFDPDTEH